MSRENIEKTPPKGPIRFSISLSDEQREAKAEIIKHPFNLIQGLALALSSFAKKIGC